MILTSEPYKIETSLIFYGTRLKFQDFYLKICLIIDLKRKPREVKSNKMYYTLHLLMILLHLVQLETKISISKN